VQCRSLVYNRRCGRGNDMNGFLVGLGLLANIALWTTHGAGRDEASAPLAGRWIVTADFTGTTIYFQLELTQDGTKLGGKFEGDKLEGALTGSSIQFRAADQQGDTSEVRGTIDGGKISGTVVFVDVNDPAHPESHSFTAEKVPPRPPGPPQTHQFAPTVFYRQFSPFNKPVLKVAPGDTIHTATVDAGGVDDKGITRVLGGNPETGPFYVETAAPGDTLVVHLKKLRLNRDWASSDDSLVGRVLDTGMAMKMKDLGKQIRWHLDRERGIATPENPAEHLKRYSVPLRPMLGCIATATGPAQAPPGTGDSGGYGGNMDFNGVVEGATVYLPVRVPGALLYLGDGHAAQGDGELNGNALETSMDVDFTVDVLPAKRLPGARIESATHVVAVGLGGSLEDAMREATGNMADWLIDDYKLTPSELAQVLGTSAEYSISEVADRNVGVVLKINRERINLLVRQPQ
jgi:amidase